MSNSDLHYCLYITQSIISVLFCSCMLLESTFFFFFLKDHKSTNNISVPGNILMTYNSKRDYFLNENIIVLFNNNIVFGGF